MFVNVFKNVVIFANRWLQTTGSPTEGVREAQGWICTFLNNVYKIKELKFSYKDTWQGLNSNIGLWNSHKLLTIYWSCQKVAPNSKSCQKSCWATSDWGRLQHFKTLEVGLAFAFFSRRQESHYYLMTTFCFAGCVLHCNSSICFTDNNLDPRRYPARSWWGNKVLSHAWPFKA